MHDTEALCLIPVSCAGQKCHSPLHFMQHLQACCHLCCTLLLAASSYVAKQGPLTMMGYVLQPCGIGHHLPGSPQLCVCSPAVLWLCLSSIPVQGLHLGGSFCAEMLIGLLEGKRQIQEAVRSHKSESQISVKYVIVLRTRCPPNSFVFFSS